MLRLGDHCTKIGSGATPRGGKESYNGGATALVRSQNVHNDGFRRAGLVFIDDQQAKELEGVELQAGDVLLNITGDSVARCCQVVPAVLPARVNQHVAIIRPNPHTLDARFLRYALISPAVQTRLMSLASAGATRNALTKSMIEDLELSAPSVDEQRAISAVLAALDDKIDLNRRMNETLEETARELFKSWFVDFDPVRAKAEERKPFRLDAATAALFPSEFSESDLGEIPTGWRAADFLDVAALNPESWTARSRPSTVRYVDLANTKWGRIMEVATVSGDQIPSRAQRVLRPGDTLVGTVRPANGSYALVAAEGLTGSTGFAVMRPKSRVLSGFVYLAATRRENIEQLQHLADGGAYPAVRPEVVASQPLVVPSPAVLDAFSSFVSPLLERFAQAEVESGTLGELRDYLLPKLLSGEVRVRDAEKLVGEAT